VVKSFALPDITAFRQIADDPKLEDGRAISNRVMTLRYQSIESAFAGTGLSVRGGFSGGADLPPGTRAIVLLGNAGPGMWPHFAAGRRDEPDALDAWTKRLAGPIAASLDASAAYPSDRPYHPFQRWAVAAEPVHASPLGILIHPAWGLWHAYRAALLFAEPVEDLPPRQPAANPCDSCRDKPCLTACPVSAFDGTRYDVAACGTHLLAEHDPKCAGLGCRARDACPVARDMRYLDAQIRFHMAAFVRSRRGQSPGA
jgi:ferredoxin